MNLNRDTSGQEDNKYDEEDQDDHEYLYHEPPVQSDAFEVFEQFCVCSLHIELCLADVGVNSERGERMEERGSVIHLAQ